MLADKAAAMAKVSAKGGFYLFWGIIVSTVISAVGVIVLARVLAARKLWFIHDCVDCSTFDWDISRLGHERRHG